MREEDGSRFLVGFEETFDGCSEVVGGLVIALHGEVEDRIIDGAEDPSLGAAIGEVPLGVVGAWRRRVVDVRFEPKFAAH